MILVDTSVWIDYFRGNQTAQTEALDSLLSQEQIAMGDLILTEVLQGFRHNKQFDLARGRLSELPFFDLGGYEIAVQSARNYRRLRAAGATIRKTINALVATWCIENGFRLLHDDRDFDAYEKHLGLRVLKCGH
ncbi:MAG: PIN domain nuclease [Acidobacteria bacterium]|nr:PIN domain nuclease [Acidobacteriota bacterium]